MVVGHGSVALGDVVARGVANHRDGSPTDGSSSQAYHVPHVRAGVDSRIRRGVVVLTSAPEEAGTGREHDAHLHLVGFVRGEAVQVPSAKVLGAEDLNVLLSGLPHDRAVAQHAGGLDEAKVGRSLRVVHQAAPDLCGAGDVAALALDGGRRCGDAGVKLHCLCRDAVAPRDKVKVLRPRLDHDERRHEAQAADSARDEVGGLGVHATVAVDAVVGLGHEPGLPGRLARHVDGLLAEDGALVGGGPHGPEVAGGEEVLPLGGQHQRVRDPALAVCEHPPTVGEAERQVFSQGPAVLHLVEDDVPPRPQQGVARGHRRRQVDGGVNHVGGQDLVHLVAVKALVCWMLVAIEDGEFHEGELLSESAACVRQEGLGQVRKDIPGGMGVEGWQDEGGGTAGPRANLEDVVVTVRLAGVDAPEDLYAGLIAELCLGILLVPCGRAGEGKAAGLSHR
mmetsp:Transcript_120766/g.376044  ORF Transcript_120766/g.376044 Transcript_120766/m.376044 type:complete len:451 (+) Transcript_120766:595-1947(+)